MVNCEECVRKSRVKRWGYSSVFMVELNESQSEQIWWSAVHLWSIASLEHETALVRRNGYSGYGHKLNVLGEV